MDIEREADTGMRGQILRRLRRAFSRQISRCGNCHHFKIRRNADGDHILRHIGTHTHPYIKTLCDNIDKAVIQIKLHLQFGMLRQKIAQFRINNIEGDILRSINPYLAHRRLAESSHFEYFRLNDIEQGRNALA